MLFRRCYFNARWQTKEQSKYVFIAQFLNTNFISIIFILKLYLPEYYANDQNKE